MKKLCRWRWPARRAARAVSAAGALAVPGAGGRRRGSEGEATIDGS